MPAEKTPRDLIGKAFTIQQDRKAEEASVEEAERRILELTTKIDELVKDATPSSSNLVYPPTKVTTRRATFFVPVSRGEAVGVLVTQKTQTAWETKTERLWEINVEQLDSKLVIGEKRAFVESKDHISEPFDMHTPIGPRSNPDLGPVWRRGMNMVDFAAYNRVLDRLSQPGVTRKD